MGLQSRPVTADRSAAQSRQVSRSAGIIAAATAISRLTGLAREMILAQLFGASLSFDAFLLAVRIPNLTRDLFAEGALTSAFVPTFTKALADGKREALTLANLVGTAILVVVSSVCLLGILFTPQLVALLAPGFLQEPVKFHLAVHLTRIMFPFLLLIALAAQTAGMLNACGSFGVPALASALFNVGSVCAGLLLGVWLGPRFHIVAIEGMAYGVLIGGVLQLAWQIPCLRSCGFSFRLAFDRYHPGLRQISALMAPAIIANAALQINVVINTSFASRLIDPVRGHDGPVSWLGYSLRIVQVPLGLFGVAFAAAMLPWVARNVAAGDLDQFRQTLSRSLANVFLFTMPCSVALIILGRPIVGAIYQGGRFGAYDTSQTALALSCYSVGLLAYSSAKILNPAFYALSDARTPMLASLLSVLVNVGAPFLLLDYFHFGFAALALTTSAAVALESTFLALSLRRRLRGLCGPYLVNRFWRITAACLPMAAALLWLTQGSAKLENSRIGYLADLSIYVPIGALTFLVAARFLGLTEIPVPRLRTASLRSRLSAARVKIGV